MDKYEIWARIDNRLIHGQVIETWIPYCKSKFVIVANDELAEDPLRQEIMKLAIPKNIKIFFSKIVDLMATIDEIKSYKKQSSIFVLFADCKDARRAFDSGLKFYVLNIGNLHYSPGKKQVCDHVFLAKEDISCLKYLEKQGITLDFRCVPNNPINIKVDEVWI